jgi:hypothetical protein
MPKNWTSIPESFRVAGLKVMYGGTPITDTVTDWPKRGLFPE